MNLIEITFTVYQEKSLAGASRDLMKKYLEDIPSALVDKRLR
jgi:hypothetical protein